MATADIIHNSPALHSLKREQLVKLCKKHGIKASGKNSDLISKLKAYATAVDADQASSVSTYDSDGGDGDLTTRSGRASEQWEDLASAIAQDDQFPHSYMQPTSSPSSKASSTRSREFGRRPKTTTKGDSSVGSSIKAFASSLKRAGTILSLKAAARSQSNVSQMDVDDQEGDAHSASSTHYDDDNDVFAEQPALNNDVVSSDPDLPATIRLVTSDSSSWPTMTPALKPFATSFSLADGTPSAARSLYPVLAAQTDEDDDSDPAVPGSFNSPDAAPTPKPSRLSTTQRLSQATPFVFGSSESRVSNAQFQTVASAVLDEMNRRLGATGTSTAAGMTLLTERGKLATVGLSGTGQSSAPTDRFAQAHEARFSKMDSIVNHYAAKRGAPTIGTKRKAEEMDDSVASKAKKAVVTTVNEHGEVRSPKRRRTIVENEQPDPEAVVRDRDLVKKKLEVSKAKRQNTRSGPNVGSVASPKSGIMASARSLVGRILNRSPKSLAAAAVPGTPTPKPPVPKVVKPSLAPVTKPTVAPRAPTVPTGSQAQGVTRKTSAATGVVGPLSRKVSAVIGPLARKASASSSGEGPSPRKVSTTTSTSGPSSRKVSAASSVAGSSSQASKPNVSGIVSLQPRQRTESRLLAPTASSLAKKQSFVRPQNKPSLGNVRSIVSPAPATVAASVVAPTPALASVPAHAITPAHVPAPKPKPAPVLSPKSPTPQPLAPSTAVDKLSTITNHTNMAKSGSPSKAPQSPSKHGEVKKSTPKQAVLAPRRPRISRSKIITKLGEKRAATATTTTTSTDTNSGTSRSIGAGSNKPLGHERRSLVIKDRSGEKAGRRSLAAKGRITDKQASIDHAARKRIKQSEIRPGRPAVISP